MLRMPTLWHVVYPARTLRWTVNASRARRHCIAVHAPCDCSLPHPVEACQLDCVRFACLQALHRSRVPACMPPYELQPVAETASQVVYASNPRRRYAVAHATAHAAMQAAMQAAMHAAMHASMHASMHAAMGAHLGLIH